MRNSTASSFLHHRERERVGFGAVRAFTSVAAFAVGGFLTGGSIAAEPRIASSTQVLRATSAAPYPASTVIGGVRIDWSTHQRGAIGSDNFMMTWAGDDHQYGIWGDGGGFGGDNRKFRVLFGVARIEGPHDAFRPFNRLGHRDNSEHEAKLTGKSWGMVSVDGVLYAWIHPDPVGGTGGKWDWIFREARLHRSTDHGATWHAADWAFTSDDRLAGGNILQFGRDYAGARDDFVYHYMAEVVQPDVATNRLQAPGKLILLRAPKTQLMDRGAYEVYAGMSDAQPRWSKQLSDRRPIFEDANGIGPTAGISYNPGLKRYLLCIENSQPTAGLLGIFEAPEPWGPWSTVVYLTKSQGTWFGHNNDGPHEVPPNNFFWHFPTKWMDANGRDVSLNFTGGGRGKDNDSFNTVRVRLLPAEGRGATALPAFPGAEGFGANAKGGRGGRVIAVTSLADAGPGTLRAACEAEGPRTVVFRVGGTIALQSQITIRNPYITIAGQTAPGDGILIRKGNSKVTPIGIRTHDVIMRCIRIRSGDSPDGSQTDCLEIHNAAPGDYVGDIILDHCSFSWSTDENLAIMGRYRNRGVTHPTKRPDMIAENWERDDCTTNITVQWCINSEGLDTPQVHKSRAALTKFIRSLSYHHNLMAHFVAARNPRLQGHEGTFKDVVNNVVYNTGRYGTGPSDGVLFNYVGNYQKSGADTGRIDFSIGNYAQPPDFKVYLKCNYHSGLRTSDDQDESVILEPNCRSQVVATPFPAPPVRTTSAAQAFEEVLRHAGCIVPRRDSVDERIIAEVRNGTGRMKTSVADAGGYPEIAGGTPPADADHDGMPDAWELERGLDPKNPDDRNGDRDGDGYTNLEEYLNLLIPPIERAG